MFYVIGNCILVTPFSKGKPLTITLVMMLKETQKQQRIKFEL